VVQRLDQCVRRARSRMRNRAPGGARSLSWIVSV
jgi:hypothetical protein